MAEKKTSQKAGTSKQKTVKKEGSKMASPHISMLLYGVAGSGKSIFASTFPKPLIFDFDQGHKIYEAQGLFPDATYVRGHKSLAYLQKAVELIEKGENKFETLVIDSVTNLENVAVSKFKGYDGSTLASTLYSKGANKLGYDEWGNISSSTIAIMTKLREFPVNIVLITQVSESDGKYSPELIGKGRAESLHFADYVMFIEAVGGEKGITRYGHLTSSKGDSFVAKARGLANVDPIENPNYDKLMRRITTSKTKLDFSDSNVSEKEIN